MVWNYSVNPVKNFMADFRVMNEAHHAFHEFLSFFVEMNYNLSILGTICKLEKFIYLS